MQVSGALGKAGSGPFPNTPHGLCDMKGCWFLVREVQPEPQKTTADPVDHPSHYTDHPYRCECGKGIECIDIIEELPYNIGAAIKYIWRAGLKDSAKHQEDLKKAAWHINREQERLFKTVTEKVSEKLDKQKHTSHQCPRCMLFVADNDGMPCSRCVYR